MLRISCVVLSSLTLLNVNQPLGPQFTKPTPKPKPALKASAFSMYFLLVAILHLILCSCCLYDLYDQSAFFHCLLANLCPFQCLLCLFYRHHSESINLYILRICLLQKDTFQFQIFVELLFLLQSFQPWTWFADNTMVSRFSSSEILYSGPSYVKLAARFVLCGHNTMYRGDLISLRS